MSSKNECAGYFRTQQGYDRAFGEMRKKWESYGRAAGSVRLSRASEEEQRAMEGILGRKLSQGELTFTLGEFEKALQQTRFAPITLKELLEAYFGEELRTKKEHLTEQRLRKETFFCQLGHYCEEQQLDETVRQWISEAHRQQKWGYSVLVSEWKKGEADALQLGKNVGRALELTLKEPDGIPLAVLAAKVTNNPHYFDRGTIPGNLLVHALCFAADCDFPKTAYAWRQLLEEAGIMPDTLSNMVTAYGIHLKTEKGLHPAYEAFCRMEEAYMVTAYNLKRVTEAYAENSIVYVVENEMVFSYLLESLEGKKTAMICTSGQLRTAAAELIRMLAESGSRICYSGDLDPEGMVIADKLWQRYPRNIEVWRMSREDYCRSISGEQIETRRLEMLRLLKNPVLRETAAELRREKRAGYQENLLQDLVRDITG